MTTKNTTLLKKNNLFLDKNFTLGGLLVIFLAAGLLLFNAFYGLGIPDEPFYLTIPYRMLKGDKLFVNEWHLTQLSAVLQYPFVWLFVKITDGGDGLILFFRLLFVLSQLLIACCIFIKMRGFGFVSALTAALLFELYIPDCTMSLDYYTLSLFAVLVISILLIFSEKQSAPKYMLCGMLLACAVLAEPPLAVTYLAYLVAVIIKRQRDSLFSFKALLLVTAGIAVVAVGFLIFLFSDETISEWFSALKIILGKGEAVAGTKRPLVGHLYGTLFVGYPMYIKVLFHSFSYGVVFSIVYLLAISIKRLRKNRRLLAFIGVIIAAVCLSVSIGKTITSGNPLPFLNLPYVIAFLGLSAFLLSSKKDKRLLCFWLVGASYILLIASTSEGTKYIGSYGFVVSCVASIPLINNLFVELLSDRNKEYAKRHKKRRQRPVVFNATTAVAVVLCISILFVFGGMLLSRDPVASEFGRASLKETMKVDRGAYKGINVAPKQKAVYDSILKDIDYIESQTNGKYTVLSNNSWYLLSSNRAPLAFTLWYLGDMDTYMRYYRYLGEYPEYIYIASRHLFFNDAGSIMNVEPLVDYFADSLDCTVAEGEAGFILKVNKVHTF